MKHFMSVQCLRPCLVLAIAWMPGTWSVAAAQQSPALKEAQGTNVIEVIKGSRVDRVVIKSDDRASAIDRRSAAGADELTRKIEIFKGGGVVVLTVVDNDEGKPIAARIDAIKNRRESPANLLPVRLRAAGPASPGGPTHLLPVQPRDAGPAARGGPTNLLPVRASAAGEAPGGTSNPVPPSSSVVGAAFRDLPAAAGGVLVASVKEGSPAWQDGLRQADVIGSVNRTSVRDVGGLKAELASAGSTAVLQVRRGTEDVIVVLRR